MSSIHSQSQLLQAANRFLAALSSPSSTSRILLSFFSTIQSVTLDHSPSNTHFPQYSMPFVGLHAVRSYFDLISMHYTRVSVTTHTTHVYSAYSRVAATASIVWRWNSSGHIWTEDIHCTFEFDNALKMKSFIVKTQSPENTCVLRAVDRAESFSPQASPAQDASTQLFSGWLYP
jgi:hypothetical protein